MFGRGCKVKLDPVLYDKARDHAARRGYASVEEFVTHLIEGALARAGSEGSEGEHRNHLSGLGYIS